MKIAYLCTSKSLGGLELNHLRNALWMKSRNHSVLCIVTKDSPLALEAKKLDLPVHYISYPRRYYSFVKSYFVAKCLKKHKITHLFIRDNRDMSMLASIKFLLRNELTTVYFMEMQLGLKKRGFLHTIRFMFLDYWFCPLPYLQKQVLEWTKIKSDKVKLLPSGMDFTAIKKRPVSEARSMLNLPEGIFILGLIGRFDRLKGQLLVLEAMKFVKSFDFVIVFLGEETKNEANGVLDEIMSIIERNHWENKVLMRPFMDEVGVFYSAIDALIMATRAETFGMVTLEAISYDLPVIGSNLGGTPDLLGGGRFGLLFESENAQALASAIGQIQNMKYTIDSIERQQFLEQFNHNSVCARIEEYLN